MFSTQVELDSDLRCHRNIRGLEEFLNKANRSLLWYLVSINDISAWFYTVDFLLLTWELSLPCLVVLRCPKKSEINLLQTFSSRSRIARCKSMYVDCVIYPFTNIMLNLLPYYILYSSLFYVLNITSPITHI